MMSLLPHNRLHIPDRMAMFAALLLLITSVTGFESRQETHSSGQESIHSADIEHVEKSPVNDGVEHKRRGLNLGLPLFRRG